MIRLQTRAIGILGAFLLIVPLIAGVGVRSLSAQRALSPPLAEAMPAGVQAFVSTDFDLSNDQYIEATALTARLIIPGAGKTVAVIVQQIAGFLGIIPEDVRQVLEGEIGIGLLGADISAARNSSTPVAIAPLTHPHYAIVLHPNKADSARQLVENWFTQQAQAQGVEPERTQTGDTVMLAKPHGTATSFPTAPAVVIFSGDYILMGADKLDLLSFVEAIQGTIATLADSTDLSTLAAALPNERLLFGYVDGPALTDSITGVFRTSLLAAAIDPPFGTTAFTVAAGATGLRFESVSLPVAGTTPHPLSPAPNPDFAAHLPDTTLAMVAGNDLGKSWLIEQVQKAILSFVMSAMGGGEVDLSDTGLASQFSVLSMLTGIDFKTDLMDQLHGPWGAALLSLDPENPLASSAVISSDPGDIDRVSVGVTSLGPLLQSIAAGSASITTASVAGQTVNNITLLDQDSPATIQYGVVNDQLMIGLGDGLSQFTRQPDTSLAADSAYQTALAELPDDYSSLVYIDVRALTRQLAPTFIETFATGSSNPLAQCLVANTEFATPIPIEPAMNRTAGTLCAVIGLVFGENSLQDYIVSHLPGPFMAVSYQSGDLQHVSGILLVGE